MKKIEELEKLREMLEYLELPKMLESFLALYKEPRYAEMDKMDFLEEIVTPEYEYKYNQRLQRDLRLGSLSFREGDYDSLFTHDGRCYNENTLKQVKNFTWAETGKNVCVFGQSGVGKSYFLVGMGIEACKMGIKTLYMDYNQLKDELVYLKGNDTPKYYKRLKHYSNIPLLLIDDFLSESTSPEALSILFQLIRERDVRNHSTMVGSQYDPSEWVQLLTGNNNVKGEADSFRRRLVQKGYLITITVEEPGSEN